MGLCQTLAEVCLLVSLSYGHALCYNWWGVVLTQTQVGTVGGGTQLASQSGCLDLLGVKGANRESPGSNARLLATVVASAVLAGELSLISAQAAGHLVQSHMKYNRSSKDLSKALAEATADKPKKCWIISSCCFIPPLGERSRKGLTGWFPCGMLGWKGKKTFRRKERIQSTCHIYQAVWDPLWILEYDLFNSLMLLL